MKSLGVERWHDRKEHQVVMADAEESEFSKAHIKHLEFIQEVIGRLGNLSFLIKGWTLTLIAVFLGISSRVDDWTLTAVTLVPLTGFWLLDGYFLRQERLFRKLYDRARIPDQPVELFSMNTGPYKRDVRSSTALLSATIIGFYGTLILLTLILVGIRMFNS